MNSWFKLIMNICFVDEENSVGSEAFERLMDLSAKPVNDYQGFIDPWMRSRQQESLSELYCIAFCSDFSGFKCHFMHSFMSTENSFKKIIF